MKTYFRIAAGFVVLFLSVGRSEATKVRVQARPELRIGIVDSNRDVASRDALHAAFAAGIAAAINKDSANPLGVKTKCVGADNAAFNLRAAVYDAVLVIGTSLPRPLMLSETSRLTATLNSGKADRKAFLIFGVADEGLGKVLTEAFTPAVSDEKFLSLLDGEAAPVAAAESGPKVAARQ